MNHHLMNLAIHRKEYNLLNALKISSKIKIHHIHKKYDTYEDCFNDSISIFNDKELIDMGLDVCNIKIKDTLEDFIRAWFDWGYETVYKHRTKLFGDYFNFSSFSPYINDKSMVNFCLSLPLEMKLCLGRNKHILKESIVLPLNIKHNMSNKIFPNIYYTVKNDMKKLIKKYLQDKNRIIFSYLPYDKIQKYIGGDYIKEWNLLNLSIWLEIRR
jgi:hypothetical protein